METVSSQKTRLVEALVREHQGAVRGYLVVLGCPGHLLDDLVQDVFLALLRARFEDRGPASTAAYLRKIARHLYLKTMQRERRQPTASELAVAEESWEEFQGSDGGDRYLSALTECLGRLRERARSVIGLRYEERLGREAIAARLGISGEGVKSILARTKRSLRECVQQRLAT
ncbi:MAG: sigma-70 family RNA polymerase sigma factor [Planctomycetota bacterium]